MPADRFPRDRFDDVPRDRNRVGAHRAENPRLKMGVVLLWALVGLVVLFSAGVVGTLALTDGLPWQQNQEAQPGPEPEVEAKLDTTYTVLVLNASGDDSRTQPVADKIVAAGWPADLVLPSVASEQDFTETTVFYVEDADAPAALALAEVLGVTNIVKDATYAQTQGDEKAPLTVVIGVDAGE